MKRLLAGLNHGKKAWDTSTRVCGANFVGTTEEERNNHPDC